MLYKTIKIKIDLFFNFVKNVFSKITIRKNG